METLKVKSIQGTTKLVGIIMCMGGVITLAIYKGPLLKLPLCPHLNYHGQEYLHRNIPSGVSTSWLKGCVLMITSNILWGLWLVLQGLVLKVYPSKLYFTTLQSLTSSIQSFIIAIAFERDISAWKLGFNLRLVAVIYCGFFVTGVAYYLQSWVIEKRGPVFLSMFTPLSLLFTSLSSTILLCEIITLGSILGGLLLIIGLYCVLWGKSKEKINNGGDKIGLQKENDVVCNEVKVIIS